MEHRNDEGVVVWGRGTNMQCCDVVAKSVECGLAA
jgi:hypothetical protein